MGTDIGPTSSGRYQLHVRFTNDGNQPRAVPTKAAAVDPSGADRTFHPDYARTLTVDQMNSAWNAEIDRIMEPPSGLGGG